MVKRWHKPLARTQSGVANRSARVRESKLGDQVLVVGLTVESRCFMKGQEPSEITKVESVLSDDYIEDCLAEFENMAFKAWPRSRWAELVQSLFTEEYWEVYHLRDQIEVTMIGLQQLYGLEK